MNEIPQSPAVQDDWIASNQLAVWIEDSHVIWEGKIEIGSKPSGSDAVPMFIPDDAKNAGTLLTGVSAKFQQSP